MELSTTIPITTIKAASVTIFSSIPAIYIMATDMNVLSGIVMAATIAERRGKRTIITRMITAIEMSRSLRKSRTLLPTTLGWSAILVIITSSGSSSLRKSDITLSTSFPYSTMLLPRFISIESNMHG